MVDLPERPDAAQPPRVGVDEWVAAHGERQARRTGVQGALARGWDRLPPFGRLGIFVVPAAFLPFLMSQENLTRYALYTLEGSFDRGGTVYTEIMRGPDPATGKPMRVRTVTEIGDKGTMLARMYGTRA